MTISVSGAVSVQGPAQQGSGGSLRMTLLNDKSGIYPAFERGLWRLFIGTQKTFSQVSD